MVKCLAFAMRSKKLQYFTCKNSKIQILGVPIENQCVKGGGLLYGGCILVFLHFVLFVFCSICIMLQLYFVTFVFWQFIIWFFLYFVMFVFWNFCILFYLYFVPFVFYCICILLDLYFGNLYFDLLYFVMLLWRIFKGRRGGVSKNCYNRALFWSFSPDIMGFFPDLVWKRIVG